MKLLSSGNEIIGLSIGQKAIVCSWLQKKSRTPTFILRDQKTIAIDQFDCDGLIIYNSTKFIHSIQSFINRNKLHRSYLALSLGRPGLLETIVNLKTDKPSSHHIQSETTNNIVWDYVPIGYNNRTEKFCYYICGIAREILFQYTLLALKLNLRCITVIPQRIALLHTLSAINNHNSNIDGTITNHASLQKYIAEKIDTLNIEKYLDNRVELKKEQSIEALGLTLMGQKIYEHH